MSQLDVWIHGRCCCRCKRVARARASILRCCNTRWKQMESIFACSSKVTSTASRPDPAPACTAGAHYITGSGLMPCCHVAVHEYRFILRHVLAESMAHIIRLRLALGFVSFMQNPASNISTNTSAYLMQVTLRQKQTPWHAHSAVVTCCCPLYFMVSTARTAVPRPHQATWLTCITQVGVPRSHRKIDPLQQDRGPRRCLQETVVLPPHVSCCETGDSRHVSQGTVCR